MLTGLERLRIPDDQAHKLGAAIKEVERHFDIPMLSPKKRALVRLAWVAGRIYVPMARDVISEGKRARPAPGAPVARPAATVQPVTSEHVPDATDWAGVLNPDDFGAVN